MKVALIRHTATEASAERRLLGSELDQPLSVEGNREASVIAKTLAKRYAGRSTVRGAIAASPLKRATQTASQIHDRLVGWNLRSFWGLRERHFGDWTGRNLEDVCLENAESAARFRGDPLSVTPRGGEMTVDFVERVLGAWTAALDWAADKDVLLVVTHDGPIRVLLRELGHVDATDVPVFGITTGATYWLRYHRGGWKLSGDQSDPLWTS